MVVIRQEFLNSVRPVTDEVFGTARISLDVSRNASRLARIAPEQVHDDLFVLSTHLFWYSDRSLQRLDVRDPSDPTANASVAAEDLLSDGSREWKVFEQIIQFLVDTLSIIYVLLKSVLAFVS